MNKIVRRHFPASKLPEGLREEFAPDAEVTIVVEEEAAPSRVPLTLEEMFALSQPTFASGKEVDDYVRAMRDEWDRED